jgi:hypothetical protein
MTKNLVEHHTISPEIHILQRKKALFTAQMDAYNHYTMLVSLWQIFVQILAYTAAHDIDFLICSDNGWQWVYSSIYGSVFTLLHMMSIMMQTIMVMKIFYLVPSKQGYFMWYDPKVTYNNDKKSDDSF